jgi:hypothetical protein
MVKASGKRVFILDVLQPFRGAPCLTGKKLGAVLVHRCIISDQQILSYWLTRATGSLSFSLRLLLPLSRDGCEAV